MLSFTQISPNHWNQISNTEVHRLSTVRQDIIRFLNDIAHFEGADVSNPANTLEQHPCFSQQYLIFTIFMLWPSKIKFNYN